jgi:hypothetical protein
LNTFTPVTGKGSIVAENKSDTLKKITVRDLLGKNPTVRLIPEGKKEIALCRVVGIVRDYKVGTTAFGTYQKFLGDFQGVSLIGDDAGVQKTSVNACFPPVIADTLLNSLLTNKGMAVQFGYEIGLKESDKKGGAGYEYTAKPLVKPAESDQLKALAGEFLTPAATGAKK